MPKKNWTDEERKAFGEKMKRARQSAEVPEEILNEDIQALRKEIEELKTRSFSQQVSQAPQVGAQGIVGTFEKYILDPSNYPDPCERLAKEDRLQQFAFPLNYELQFEISSTSYKTQDGIQTKEPKFRLQLIKIMMDEETNEPTNKRYLIRQAVFHEDPDTALAIAREKGLEVGNDQKAFLNEMRYLRMRDWLFENFYTPNNTSVKSNKKEMVIGNRLVEVYEISSPTPSSIPFSDLKGKV